MTPNTVWAFIYSLVSNLPRLVCVTWPLLLPVSLFVIFVAVFNDGGIVVGDKDNHRMVLHFAMPVHLFMIISLLLGPKEVIASVLEVSVYYKNQLLSSTTTNRRKVFLLLQLIAVSGIVCLVLYKGCLSHPFLEADNR